MILLREVLLPIMVRVTPPVPPLKCLVCGHVYVLKIVISAIGTIATRAGDGEGASWALGVGQTGHGGHQGGTDCSLKFNFYKLCFDYSFIGNFKALLLPNSIELLHLKFIYVNSKHLLFLF